MVKCCTVFQLIPGPIGGVGPTGPTGPSSGSSSLFVSITRFVDSIYGTPAGIPDDMGHPFDTIENALVSYNPLTDSPTTIHVQPGDYTITSNIARLGLTYYFEPNATVHIANLTAFSTSSSMSVTGYGNFLVDPNGRIATITGGTFFFECYSVVGSSSLNLIQVSNSAIVQAEIKGNVIMSAGFLLETTSPSNSTCSLNYVTLTDSAGLTIGDGLLSLSARKISSESSTAVFVNAVNATLEEVQLLSPGTGGLLSLLNGSTSNVTVNLLNSTQVDSNVFNVTSSSDLNVSINSITTTAVENVFLVNNSTVNVKTLDVQMTIDGAAGPCSFITASTTCNTNVNAQSLSMTGVNAISARAFVISTNQSHQSYVGTLYLNNVSYGALTMAGVGGQNIFSFDRINHEVPALTSALVSLIDFNNSLGYVNCKRIITNSSVPVILVRTNSSATLDLGDLSQAGTGPAIQTTIDDTVLVAKINKILSAVNCIEINSPLDATNSITFNQLTSFTGVGVLLAGGATTRLNLEGNLIEIGTGTCVQVTGGILNANINNLTLSDGIGFDVTSLASQVKAQFNQFISTGLVSNSVGIQVTSDNCQCVFKGSLIDIADGLHALNISPAATGFVRADIDVIRAGGATRVSTFVEGTSSVYSLTCDNATSSNEPCLVQTTNVNSDITYSGYFKSSSDAVLNELSAVPSQVVRLRNTTFIEGGGGNSVNTAGPIQLNNQGVCVANAALGAGVTTVAGSTFLVSVLYV